MSWAAIPLLCTLYAIGGGCWLAAGIGVAENERGMAWFMAAVGTFLHGFGLWALMAVA